MAAAAAAWMAIGIIRGDTHTHRPT